MEQVVMNLVLNARDAMPGGGRITLCFRREQAGASFEFGVVPQADTFAHVIVSDEGAGMSEETKRHKLSLVHGDFSPKNALLYRGKLVLLDYEVVHYGDPAFDVGFALTHFLSKANHMIEKLDRLTTAAAQFWRVYFKEVAPLGWDALEPRIVRHILGCLLARVAGKSPLEYLTAEEAARQRSLTLLLMKNPPNKVEDLIDEFAEKIEAHAKN